MYERIIEIIVLVLAKLTQNTELDEISIDELTSRGYTQEEITTAFSWLLEQLENSKDFINDFKPNKDKAYRILSENEEDLFTKEAWGEVVNLRNLGLLSNQNIESLIDWASVMGIDRMTTEQLKDYLAFNVFKLQTDKKGNTFIFLGNQSVN
jgi:uncharacterized protein Smg (DUF494 family)